MYGCFLKTDIIIGDLNINLIQEFLDAGNYLNKLDKFSFELCKNGVVYKSNDHCIRKQSNYQSCLDNILTPNT